MVPMITAIRKGMIPLKMASRATPPVTLRATHVNHVDVDADRRRDDTHLGQQHDDDAEPDRVVTQVDDDRVEYGNRQHHQCQSVHDAAAQQVDGDNRH